MVLKSIENKVLLKFAHQVLRKHLNGDKIDVDISEISKEKYAIFVTLYKNDELRGCIGTLEPELPLISGIEKYTLLAAFHDSRFSPVKKDELDNLKIEISILTKPKLVGSYREISFGKDGVVVEDFQSGEKSVFLPDVAQYFDNLKDFMEELCSQKLGREKDFYLNPNARIYVFQAIKIKDID
jgi:AmmeMemoRadiSam system protein A